MPIEDHGLIRAHGEGVGKAAADPTCTISDQQEGTEWAQTQQHRGVQALEEGYAHATQVARTVLRREPRRT